MLRRFPRNLEALEGVFAFVETALSAADCAHIDLREMQLVVEELFTNCIRYNRNGKHEIQIELTLLADRFQVVVTDRDVEPFDITQVPQLSADRPLSERRGGGMGLQMVRSICDDLRYEHKQGTSRITAEKLLRSPDV